MADWVLYGATGYTGTLLAEEAVRRGHRPLLAGRSEEKLRPLAERLGLPHAAVSLDDRRGLRGALAGRALVLHAAGPFSTTTVPMLDACLDAGVSYLDISGDLQTMERVYSCDGAARQRNIILLPAAGFDVVPTDCLARDLADRLPDATHLEIAIVSQGSPSAGSLKTLLDLLASGITVRVDGALRREPPLSRRRTVTTPRGDRIVMSLPWGDLVSAYRSTGIPNIVVYVGVRPPVWRTRMMFRLLQAASRLPALRPRMERFIEGRVRPPAAATRTKRRAWIWAAARRSGGERIEAGLETIEGYEFTAMSGVLAVERVFGLAGARAGAFTPAQLFGKDFVFAVPGTERIEIHSGYS